MGVERQQGVGYQLLLFEWGQETARHGDSGEGGTGTGACEEQQATTASERKRALTEALMEEVAEPRNLNRAYQRVKANRGAPGVDGMRVEDLRGWLGEHREELRASLLDGSYQPQLVRGVEIPKPGGGVRQLGIPTVVDRLVKWLKGQGFVRVRRLRRRDTQALWEKQNQKGLNNESWRELSAMNGGRTGPFKLYPEGFYSTNEIDLRPLLRELRRLLGQLLNRKVKEWRVYPGPLGISFKAWEPMDWNVDRPRCRVEEFLPLKPR